MQKVNELRRSELCWRTVNVTATDIPEPVGLYDPFVHAMVAGPVSALSGAAGRATPPTTTPSAISGRSRASRTSSSWRATGGPSRTRGGADVDVGAQWFGDRRLRGLRPAPARPPARRRQEPVLAAGDRRDGGGRSAGQVDELLAPMLERGHGRAGRRVRVRAPARDHLQSARLSRGRTSSALKPLLYDVQLRTPGRHRASRDGRSGSRASCTPTSRRPPRSGGEIRATTCSRASSQSERDGRRDAATRSPGWRYC